MLVRSHVFLAVFFIVAVPVFVLSGQTQSETSPYPTSPDSTVIRSSTRLVQISVVVQDNKGAPITGLTKDNFAVFDEGKQQEIAFFSAGSNAPAPAAVPPRLPPNVFTNCFDLKGELPGAVTVILFDALNTSVEDQMYVRKQILLFLKTLKPEDHVALYALTSKLLILHEFTDDTSALVKAVNEYKTKDLAIFDQSNPDSMNFANMTDNPQGWSQLGQSGSAEMSAQALADRISITTDALSAIADHVASIPGRKNLVWVSGGFPPVIENEIGQPNVLTVGSDPVLAAAEALNRADLVLYPVDARGVEIGPGMSPQVRGTPMSQIPSQSPAFFNRQNNRDSFRIFADRTGGKAFYGNNDIREALRSAFDDGRYAYTIGFYPDHAKWDGKFREVKLQLKSTVGQLRYRKGYFATPDQSADAQSAQALMQNAAASPIDATNLRMIVSGKRTDPPSSRKLELQVAIDPKQLLLRGAEKARTGAVDLLFLQRDATGATIAAEQQHIGLNIPLQQYEYLAKTGMILERHVTVKTQSTEIRVVVHDAGSGTVGSITIPMKQFFPPS
jgi:VWFA-related protein